jgi:glycosyltransferase involved in cell wall biosynthesis
MQKLESLTACFPVHDEEATVLDVAERCLAVLPAVAEHWELVIVDDGSRDGTARRLDELVARRPEVRVVRHAERRGYGAAVRSGLAAARHAHVFLTDGDGQFDPEALPRLVAGLARGDAVIGYRRCRADSWRRRAMGTTWGFLVRLLLGVRVRDPNCAFKLLPRRVLVAPALRSDGAAISAEVLLRLHEEGARFVELPIDHLPRRHGRASGAAVRVVGRAVPELLRLVRRRVRRGAARLGTGADQRGLPYSRASRSAGTPSR